MARKHPARDPQGPDLYAVVLLLAGSGQAAAADPWAAQTGAAPAAVAYACPQFEATTSLHELPGRLVHAALWQLCLNLLLLDASDDPEVVHQARIGWRRLRSTLRLLRTIEDLPAPPAAQALRPLMDQLGELRDLDVARLEVLPRYAADAAAPGEDDGPRVLAALAASAAARRVALRALLARPAIGTALWRYALWLEALQHGDTGRPAKAARKKHALRDWARARAAELWRKFKRASTKSSDTEALHRLRIRAKRLRYATEDLAPLLPPAARKWHQRAMQVQTRLGAQRDLARAVELLEAHGAAQAAARLRAAAGLLPGATAKVEGG